MLNTQCQCYIKAHFYGLLFWFNRDSIMKEDPDKPRKMTSKEGDGEEESPPSPLTDVRLPSV